MIVQLRGEVAEKLTDQVIIDCQGVGYGVLVTAEDHGALKSGQPAKLYIYEHIRENNFDLFGFIKLEARGLFEQLLGVNGVGPKMAMSIMSIGSMDSVRSAIAAGDIKYISRASGVGRRVAERIVVDLKDKVGLVTSEHATDFLASGAIQSDDEALQGLIALGFTANDAAHALASIDPKLSAEERIKLALKQRI